MRDRAGVASGCPQRFVELGELVGGDLGAGRRQVELVGKSCGKPERAGRALAADDDRRPARLAARDRARLGPHAGVLDRVVATQERPAVRLVPQALEDLQLLLQVVGSLPDLGEREPVAAVLLLVPAGAEAHLDPAAAHLVDRQHHLGKVARRAEQDRRDEDTQAERRRLAREPGEHGPGIGRRLVAVAGEALVVIGPEQGLEPGCLGSPGDGQLLLVGQPLLGLDHEREPHDPSPPCRANLPI